MMETVCTSETSVSFNMTTQRYIPEDFELHTQILFSCTNSALSFGEILWPTKILVGITATDMKFKPSDTLLSKCLSLQRSSRCCPVATRLWLETYLVRAQCVVKCDNHTLAT
jgi:hypothetical protein